MRDGWFRTGDLARRDEDGFYYIVDRAKDMIIRGGFNVYPREIEEVLMTHPDVSLAAVVGVPHDTHGEEVKAFIIRTPDAEVTAQELLAWGKEQMAAYKYPRIVEFVGDPADDLDRQDPQARARGQVTTTAVREHAADDRHRESVETPLRPSTGWRSRALVLAVLALGLGGAFLGHRLVPAVGVLTWSIGLGVVAANLGVLPRQRHRAAGPGHQEAPARRHRPARLLGLVRLDRRARPPAHRRRRREPGRHPRGHDLARAADGPQPGQEPAHRHRHRDLRGLGHRGDGGHRRRRRGGRHRRDRDGDAVRHLRARRCCRCSRVPSGSATCSSASGPAPASTRSARWSPRPARPGPPCSPSRSSSSSPASSCSRPSWPPSASSSG